MAHLRLRPRCFKRVRCSELRVGVGKSASDIFFFGIVHISYQWDSREAPAGDGLTEQVNFAHENRPETGHFRSDVHPANTGKEGRVR